MQGLLECLVKTVARDVAVPLTLDKNHLEMHHEATQGLSTVLPATTTQNFIETSDFSSGPTSIAQDLADVSLSNIPTVSVDTLFSFAN